MGGEGGVGWGEPGGRIQMIEDDISVAKNALPDC